MRCKWIETVYPICTDYVAGRERNLQDVPDKIILGYARYMEYYALSLPIICCSKIAIARDYLNHMESLYLLEKLNFGV